MKKLTIGRNSENDICVSEAFPRVSNNHATIELVDGAFYLTDHSSNGTVVNGQTIHRQQIPVTNGDQILLAGDYLLAWPVILNFFPADDTTIRRTVRFGANGIAAAQSAAQANPQAPNGAYQSRQANPQEPRREQMTSQWGAGAQGTVAERGNNPAGGNATFAEASRREGTRREGYAPHAGSSYEAGMLNSVTQSDIDDILNSISPAAALGTWFWGLFNGVYWPLAIIPLSLIPFIGQVLSIFLCTYMGLNGNRIGWQNAKNISFPQWKKKQQVELWIGIIVFIFCTAAQLFSFYWIMNYIF